MGLSHSYLSCWVCQGHKAWISLYLDHFRAVFAVSNLEAWGSISLCSKEHVSLWIPGSAFPSRGTGPLCAQHPFGLAGSCSLDLGTRETWLCWCWLLCPEKQNPLSLAQESHDFCQQPWNKLDYYLVSRIKSNPRSVNIFLHIMMGVFTWLQSWVKGKQLDSKVLPMTMEFSTGHFKKWF